MIKLYATDTDVFSDIRLFAAHIGSDVKMKAAGGVRTKEACEEFLAAGCDRIGSSSAGKIASEE